MSETKSDLTIDEKFEELPAEKQTEVNNLKDAITGQLLAELQVTAPDAEEKDVYYDKVTKEISYLAASEENTDTNKTRLGTIGPVKFEDMPDVRIHLNADKIPVYEVDDGEDQFDRATLKADGYKIKRSFIDSSVYNFAGLISYMESKAADEKWYSAMSDNLITELHDEVKGVDVEPVPVEK